MTSLLASLGNVEFFEHLLPLKKSDTTTVHETIPMHDNVPLSASTSSVSISVDEPSRSKIPSIETSFVLTASLSF